MIYIGSEVMVSPLGMTAEENWNSLLANRSGIAPADRAGFAEEQVWLSKIPSITGSGRFEKLVMQAMTQIEEGIDRSILTSPRTIVLLSSTKGELEDDINNPFGSITGVLVKHFNLANEPLIISNACISGVLAINAAGGFIDAGIYDHAIVVGCDVVSDFVVYGFQSLFAISNKPCAPFDAARNGISMGEGCGVVVLSSERSVFKDNPLQLLTGTSANDANHISGPSRTGEGLFRSVSRTLARHGVMPGDIDFICAHGTGTVFNDEMEAIAFDRLALSHIPLNSMKGYFGHTLGAAGLIETATSMQMMRQGVLLKSQGFMNTGTSIPLNVITANEDKKLNTILKTASGFGGGNASLMIRNL
jgi:3-oxoacyl-[acyl-carrier-protein] synthase-1